MERMLDRIGDPDAVRPLPPARQGNRSPGPDDGVRVGSQQREQRNPQRDAARTIGDLGPPGGIGRRNPDCSGWIMERASDGLQRNIHRSAK
ncbi:MAG TPA: hypothetical protein VMD91_13800 [Candidatus Sulfotelmatobacter sp.]|nr:hypothetical protein [Candidatus Sulfotelmatobacter sp.]